ncbi:MAG: prepilin-type cleavage/methylation domain-containing protein [Gammaproteobacteria bacterium]|nr:MAG: prepilin-type cleavage/methylation domain-containing protein [Gammaproteobacteria bacterium]
MKSFLKQDNMLLHCLRSYIHVTKASTLHIFHRGDRHVGRNSLRQTNNKQQGFTLVELVIVIVLLGIMAVGITGFITLSTQTYINVADRDELISSARFAVERLNREIRNAVPNSVRVKQTVFAGFNIQCIEFVPTVASTTYIDIPVSPEIATDILTVIPFIGSDGNNYQCTGNCLDAVVVYPLNSGDLFNNQFDGVGKVFGLKTVTVSSAIEWALTLDRSLGVIFDDNSPTQRLFIIRAPVSYCVASNSLLRYDNYGYSPTQLVPPIAPAKLMAEDIVNMDLNESAFSMLNATLQRNALVDIKLHFSRNNENIIFDNQIHISNIP